jgi:hypothetical protein
MLKVAVRLWKSGGRCFGASEPFEQAHRKSYGAAARLDILENSQSVSSAARALPCSGGTKYLQSIEWDALLIPERRKVWRKQVCRPHNNRMVSTALGTIAADSRSAYRADVRVLQRSAGRRRRLTWVCEHRCLHFLRGVAALQRIVESTRSACGVQTKFQIASGRNTTHAMCDVCKQKTSFRNDGRIRRRATTERWEKVATPSASAICDASGLGQEEVYDRLASCFNQGA